MKNNPIIDTMLKRKSIRKYKAQMPSDEVIQTVVRAGQQAPFASQLCSLLLKRGPQGTPFKAPLLFIICVDSHKWELVMAERDWQMDSDDALLLLLGMQDAALMAENMVIAAESLGMGSCFLGGMPFKSKALIRDFNLPPRVFPMVGLAMGFFGIVWVLNIFEIQWWDRVILGKLGPADTLFGSPMAFRLSMIIPAVFGSMMVLRVVPKVAWISRWSIALLVGITSGITIPTLLQRSARHETLS